MSNRYAIIDPDTNEVVNIALAEDDVATELWGSDAVALTDDDVVSSGWTLHTDGSFIEPVPVVPSAEELAAVKQHEDDNAFLDEMRAKVKAKKALTADESGRIALIQLSRG